MRPNTSSNTSGENNNSDFNAAAGTSTFDAAYLDVDFIPTASTLTMQFVFSSEEYPEFQNSVYQDFVGVWVNGMQVDLAVGDGSTDPGNANSGTNQNLYNDNTGDQFNTEMDGFTVTMTLKMDVIPGEVNSIRIGIADVGDNRYDSTLLIAGDSIQTVLIANDDSSNLFPTGTKTLDVLANDDGGGTTLTITHINGQQVSVGSTVTLSTGQSVQLNGDGTLEVIGDGDVEDFNFTYTVAGGTNTDIAFVNVSSIPCFVAGTLILTPDGDLPVESLGAGDLVITLDDGPQPVRWIGRRSVEAVDQFAPVHIRAGTFGDHNDLLVSPQHRILIRDVLAELLFGEAEVLVAAKDLVNDRSIT
ncbi:MAG: Hint domain-containing protein, partial [Planctomycetales bacterium]